MEKYDEHKGTCQTRYAGHYIILTYVATRTALLLKTIGRILADVS